jgi:prepilin-type N-terminal cleavage/methylation domain-containing protein
MSPSLQPLDSPNSSSRSGFSLVELLVTVSVLLVLMSATMPAFLNSRKASELTQAGNQLADAANLARETALTRNTITALVVVARPTTSTARQALLVVSYDAADEQWKPIGSWMRLPIAAYVADMGGTQAAQGTVKANTIAPLALKLDGRTLSNTEYSAILFYPDGRMENGTDQTRLLSTRFATDSAGSPSEALQNYYDVVVNASTSTLRVVRR